MNSTTGAAAQSTPLTAVTIDETKRRIDSFLSALFTQRIKQAELISSDYAQLWRSIAKLMLTGGKRIRPYVTLLSYSMNTDSHDDTAILPAAVAQEMLHMAMLIHDDIIDRDQLRYGIKNITGQYDEFYRPYIDDTNERLHFSNSAAIMAGDLLIAEAYSLIQQCAVDPTHIAGAQAVLSEAIFRVVGGELLDTESAFRPFDQIDALTIARQKTASYSFVSPLAMGARLADAPDDTIARLTSFGMALGVAYQLQDDILGVFGDEGVTGKSNSGDIIEGKHTHLVEQFYQQADFDQIEQFNRIFKNSQASEIDIQQARKLLSDSGAVRAVQAAIDRFATKAHSELDEIAMTEQHRATFIELIKRCTTRVK